MVIAAFKLMKGDSNGLTRAQLFLMKYHQNS